MAFDFGSIMQFVGYFVFVIFIFYGSKLQMFQMMTQIKQKLKRLLWLRDESTKALRAHLQQYVTLTPEQDTRLNTLIGSIAIPPVSHLDPAGIVPKLENIYKTYDLYLKKNVARIVPDLSQSQIENLTNSLEVAIELNMFYKVVEHFVKLAKKMGILAIYQIIMILPMLMDMAEALFTASGHFASGKPMGDGFGPMVAARFTKGFGDAHEIEGGDKETSVHEMTAMKRRVIVVKARGPGGSVGNPGYVTQDIIRGVNPALVVTVDAGLKLESEKTGEIAEGVGVAMGGPGMDRFRIEGALAEMTTPVLTFVCKMSMKEAISAMPKEVLDQVDFVYKRVLDIISENTNEGDTVVIIGVGNTMGVA